MAKARKCDGCGKYYDENRRYLVRLVIAVSGGLKEFDLCDGCIGELRKFLGIKEEGNEKCGC